MPLAMLLAINTVRYTVRFKRVPNDQEYSSMKGSRTFYKVLEDSSRFNKVHCGSIRFKNISQGSRRLKKFSQY